MRRSRVLFRRSTENEWNISQNFTTARAIHINTMATQLERYITFFTFVGDISCRQVIFHGGRWYFTSSSKSRNTREICDIFRFTAIHFLQERHSAMVLMYIYILCRYISYVKLTA